MPQIHTQIGVQSWHCMFSGFKQTYNARIFGALWTLTRPHHSQPLVFFMVLTFHLYQVSELKQLPSHSNVLSESLHVFPDLGTFFFVVVFNVEWYSTVCINPSVVPHGRTLLASFNNLTKMPEVRMRRVYVASAFKALGSIPTGRIKGARDRSTFTL